MWGIIMPPISVIHHIHAESEYSCVPNSTTYRIDEHLEEIAENLIVEHLFYIKTYMYIRVGVK